MIEARLDRFPDPDPDPARGIDRAPAAHVDIRCSGLPPGTVELLLDDDVVAAVPVETDGSVDHRHAVSDARSRAVLRDIANAYSRRQDLSNPELIRMTCDSGSIALRYKP